MLKFHTLESGFRADGSRSVVRVVDVRVRRRREIVYVLARSIFSLLAGCHGSQPVLLARLYECAGRWVCGGGGTRSASIGSPGGPCRIGEWRGGQW